MGFCPPAWPLKYCLITQCHETGLLCHKKQAFYLSSLSLQALESYDLKNNNSKLKQTNPVAKNRLIGKFIVKGKKRDKR